MKRQHVRIFAPLRAKACSLYFADMCMAFFSYSNSLFQGKHFVSEKEVTVDIAPIVNKYVLRPNCRQLCQRK